MTIQHASPVENLKCILLLAKKETTCIAMNVDPEEVVNVAKICHGELGFERSNTGGEEGGCVGCKDYVVNVEEEIGNLGTTAKDEQGGVASGSDKAQGVKKGGEPGEPGSWRLF
jgi:hypothetical protein